MSEVTIGAPVAGWLTSLDAVPDPVFAERMMGEGVAIEPLSGEIIAPCDAEVIAVAPTAHAVTLALANGAQLLIHVGLDTVAMGGRGMTALVGKGDRVLAGTPLLRVDLDLVATEAVSAITPIVVANAGFAVTPIGADRRVGPGDPIATVTRIGAGASASVPTGETLRRGVVVPLANGIHARPAARIGAVLKPFAATVSVEHAGGEADARSVVALLGAAIGHGDTITLAASGADAASALDALATLIESGMGETEAHAAPALPTEGGVRAAPGFAVGPVHQHRVHDADVPRDGAGVEVERAALAAARGTVAREIGSAGTAIAEAHVALLDDPALLAAADAQLALDRSAAFAWRQALREQADRLRQSGSALVGERVADLLDVERRVLAALDGEEAPAVVAPAGSIVVAEEVLPSEVAALVRCDIAGIATAFGGPTSHAAILAASAGVPMVVAAGRSLLAVPDGREVVLDGDAGRLDLDPDHATLDAARQRAATLAAQRQTAVAAAQQPAVTRDGVRIEVVANLGGLDDAHAAVVQGAEGCGLLRTEFLFMDRAEAPDEATQRDTYAAIAAALDGRPLIVRTLDVGGDKPIAYLPMPPEENPALGQRGVRLSLARPEMLRTQFAGILAGVPAGQRRIMLPMIADAGELARARALLDEVSAAMGITQPVPLGVMVETPAAALLAESLARTADFLSVGSNDLTQYALAADRGNPAVAPMIDALHPAVLRLIALAAAGARAHGRWLGVCGAIASDPAAATLLIGLGVTELSAAPAAVPAVKAAVRGTDASAARALAERALRCATAAEVRALVGEGA